MAADLPEKPHWPGYGDLFGWLLSLFILNGAGAAILLSRDLHEMLDAPELRQHVIRTISDIAGNATLLLAGLFLVFWTRRPGRRLGILCLAFLPLNGLALAIWQMMRPAHESWLDLIMVDVVQHGSVPMAAGAIVFLWTVPRLDRVYPPYGSARRASDPAHASMGRPPVALDLGRSGVAVLIGLLLIPPAWTVLRFRDLQLSALNPEYLPVIERPITAECVFAVTCLAVIALLLLRRRWSTIQATIAFLFLADLAAHSWFIRERGLPFGVLERPADFGFHMLAALAWTCYLMESPQVHRLYPGSKRYNELLTDVDVF